jgi:hypothetical protein
MHRVKTYQPTFHWMPSLVLLMSSFAALPAATIQGEVTDPLGAVVPNAQIALLRNGSVVTTTRAAAAGTFVFSTVDAGRCRVAAEGSK